MPEVELSEDGTFTAGVPEKVVGKTPADLVKMYTELEKSRSAPAPKNETPATPPGGIPVSPQGGEADDLYAALEATGQLTPEQYQAAVAKYGKRVTDGTIAGVQARGELAHMRAAMAAGGKENYDAMISWASSNLSVQEAQAFNDAMRAGGALADLAVQGLAAKHAAAGGTKAQPIQGGPAPAGGTKAAPYASTHEWRADMSGENKVKYEQDPAFRASVASRHAASVAAGVEGF